VTEGFDAEFLPEIGRWTRVSLRTVRVGAVGAHDQTPRRSSLGELSTRRE
jgi:hypothetical protein